MIRAKSPIFNNIIINRFINLPKVDRLNWTRGLISLKEGKYKKDLRAFYCLKGWQCRMSTGTLETLI